jgi:hypothetical protein
MIKRLSKAKMSTKDIAVEETYHVESILTEADRPSTHNLVYDVAAEEEGVEVEEDEGR